MAIVNPSVAAAERREIARAVGGGVVGRRVSVEGKTEGVDLKESCVRINICDCGSIAREGRNGTVEVKRVRRKKGRKVKRKKGRKVWKMEGRKIGRTKGSKV